MRLFLAGLLLSGCNDKAANDSDQPAGADVEPVCEEPADVGCVDDLILDLSLHDDKVSEGAVTNDADGDDYVTAVDATGGGYSNATQNPWVYLKFTDDGAEKVEIDDEDWKSFRFSAFKAVRLVPPLPAHCACFCNLVLSVVGPAWSLADALYATSQ